MLKLFTCSRFCEKMHVGVPGFALRVSLMQRMCMYVGGFQRQEAGQYKSCVVGIYRRLKEFRRASNI